MIGLKRVLGLSLAPRPQSGYSGYWRARPGWLSASGGDCGQGGEAVHWQAPDEAGIPALVADGKVVFVDVTADWCLTCQANKKLVLDQCAGPGKSSPLPDVIAEKAD